MSVFTAEDVSDVAATGNAAHNALYLARFGNAMSPNGSDVSKLREFIKNKYVDRKWFANGSSTSSNTSAIDRNRSSDHHSGEHTSSDTGDLWGSKQSSTSRASASAKVTYTYHLHFLKPVFCTVCTCCGRPYHAPNCRPDLS
jgi:hypothetical protein